MPTRRQPKRIAIKEEMALVGLLNAYYRQASYQYPHTTPTLTKAARHIFRYDCVNDRANELYLNFFSTVSNKLSEITR